MVTKLNLRAVQQQLEGERARLLQHSPDLSGRKRFRRNPDRLDLATDFETRERDSVLQAVESRQLQQIEDALQRLAAGTYGQCESCGRSIAAERLQVLPYAALCVRCQTQREGVTNSN
jgi:RNA polymerase-binding protein DksA